MNDLFKQFITQEEEDRRNEIFNSVDVDEFVGYSDDEKLKMQIQMDSELTTISNNIYKRYLESRNNDINNILQDMYTTIDQVTTEEYEKHLEIEKYHYDFIINRTNTEKISSDLLEAWRTWTNKNLRSFMYFVNEKKLRDFYNVISIWNSENYNIPLIKRDLFSLDMSDADTKNLLSNKLNDALGERIYNKYIELYPNAKEKPLKEKSITPTLYKIDKMDLPLDQLNSVGRGVWDSLEQEEDGQYFLSFYGKNKSTGEEIKTIICNLTWDTPSTNISKKLTDYDKLVHNIVASLAKAGNTAITVRQIYKAMGGEGSPSADNVKKINDSLDRMRTAIFSVNNDGEREIYSSYPKCNHYDAPILSFERGEFEYKGITTTAIHLTQYPPLMKFADMHKQITTVPLGLLKAPLSNTDENIRIKYYFMESISHMKYNKNYSKKMLFDTICKNCKIKGKQIQRLPNKIEKVLQHFKNDNFISDYSIDQDKNITITL